MSRMDEWNEWRSAKFWEWTWIDLDEWEQVWMDADEWGVRMSVAECGWVKIGAEFGWSRWMVRLSAGKFRWMKWGCVWMSMNGSRWVQMSEYSGVDDCGWVQTVSHIKNQVCAWSPSTWVVVPAIVFDACGRMVIGGSGEVGECLSIDQSHFSYSVSLSSQDASSSSSQGSPDISCGANTF